MTDGDIVICHNCGFLFHADNTWDEAVAVAETQFGERDDLVSLCERCELAESIQFGFVLSWILGALWGSALPFEARLKP